jgi:hypothetical protein
MFGFTLYYDTIILIAILELPYMTIVKYIPFLHSRVRSHLFALSVNFPLSLIFCSSKVLFHVVNIYAFYIQSSSTTPVINSKFLNLIIC